MEKGRTREHQIRNSGSKYLGVIPEPSEEEDGRRDMDTASFFSVFPPGVFYHVKIPTDALPVQKSRYDFPTWVSMQIDYVPAKC